MSQIQLNKLNSQTFLRDLTRLSYLPQCLERNMGELHLVLLWMKGLHNTKSIYTQVVIKNKIKSTPKYIQLKKKKIFTQVQNTPKQTKNDTSASDGMLDRDGPTLGHGQGYSDHRHSDRIIAIVIVVGGASGMGKTTPIIHIVIAALISLISLSFLVVGYFDYWWLG